MFKFLKNNKLITFMSLVIMTALSAVVVSSLAWYTSLESKFTPKKDSVVSSVISSYFDGGDGLSVNTAFVISKPIHFYNLVHLQETNEFKVRTGGTDDNPTMTYFADAELYFQLGKKDIDGEAENDDDNIAKFYKFDDNGVFIETEWDETEQADIPVYSSSLNMQYYSGDRALPPLGTSKHPFKGHIIGNNLTVANLHINGSGYSDIGIFGYVASGATVNGVYFESPHIDAGGHNSLATGSQNHTAHTSNTYIGYIAGHVYNAQSSFTNVYVNNCELTNTTGNVDEMINTYGYFGHVERPSSVEAESASYSVEAKASDIYSAIDGSYEDGTTGNRKAATRPDYAQYNASANNYSSVMTESSSTYSLGKYSSSPNYPYSLSTVGYTSGDSVNKHARYYVGENNLGVFESGTEQLSSEPSNWSSYADGTYVYWSNSHKYWEYATVTSTTSSQSEPVTYNCFTISYTYSSTYYLKFEAYSTSDEHVVGKLISTTDAPTSSNIDDYYFVFKTSEGHTGIPEFTSNSTSANVYIYSPAHQAYLYIEDVSSTNEFVPLFKDTASVKFSINGKPTTTFLASVGGQTDALFGETTIYSSRKVTDNTATTFTIGLPAQRQSVSGYEYVRVTEFDDDPSTDESNKLKVGDTFTIAAGFDTSYIGTYDFSGYYIIGEPNTSQRAAPHTTKTNNKLDFISNAREFRLATGSQDNTYNLIDTNASYVQNSSGYLYAAGGTSDNHLKTNTLATAGTDADATITIDENGYADIKFQGVFKDNSEYRNTLLLNVKHNGSWPDWISKNGNYGFSTFFSAYSESRLGSSNIVKDETDHSHSYHVPMLYKKATVYGGYETYSACTPKEYTSAAVSQQTVTPYSIRVAPLSSDAGNPANYSTTPFNVPASRNVVFSNSRVSYEGSNEQYWDKVDSDTELESGSKYLIVYESDSTTAHALKGSLGSPTKIDSGQNGKDYTINSNGQIEWTQDTEDNSFTFTYDSTNSGWKICSASGLYIGNHNSSNGLEESDTYDAAVYKNTISISSGVATITGVGAYCLRYNNSSGASNERFRYYASDKQQSICLYKLIDADADDAVYIGDLVGQRYVPSRIDVVGPVSFNSTYYSFTETSSVSTPTAGNHFYTTSYVNSGVTIVVDKHNSRDLGHLIFSYEDSDSSHIPYFLTNGGSSKALAGTGGAGARDVENVGSSHSYILNISITTISTLAYCALNSSGEIVAMNSDSIAKYVLVLGAHTDTHIKNVQYTFINAAGNVGNFGSVDFRTATYNSDGTLSSASSAAQVSGSNISIYYDVNTVGQVFYVKVKYEYDSDLQSYVYTVTVTSSVATTLTIYVYDNSAIVKVKHGASDADPDILYGTDVVEIAATTS